MTTRTGGRRRLRTAIAAMLAAVGLLALAGCMKVDMDLTLSEDDSVSGSMIMAFSNQLAESMGMEPGELWDQAGGELQQDLPEGATQEPYSDDDYTGTKITFADIPLEEFDSGGGSGEQLSITRDGDEYVVDGTMDLSEGADQMGSLPEGVMDSFDVQISVTFPGAVGDTNGTVDGNTVTWTPAFGETTEIHARGAAEPGAGGFPWWIIGLVVGLIVIGLVVWFVVRNNRRPAAVTGTAGGDTALAAGAAPGSVPAPGAGPTPEEQVFGAPPAAPEPTAQPTAEPGTGPVAEPLEPEPAPGSPAPSGPTIGPVPEPLEPSQPTRPIEPTPTEPDEPPRPADGPNTDGPDTDGPDTERRPTPGA